MGISVLRTDLVVATGQQNNGTIGQITMEVLWEGGMQGEN